MVVILVLIECGTARQRYRETCYGVGVGDQSRNIRMGPGPRQIVVAETELQLAGDAGSKGMRPVTRYSYSVVLQPGNKGRVGTPDKIGFRKPLDRKPSHNVVAAALRRVIAPLERNRSVYHQWRRHRVDAGHTGHVEHGRGKRLQKLAGKMTGGHGERC